MIGLSGLIFPSLEQIEEEYTEIREEFATLFDEQWRTLTQAQGMKPDIDWAKVPPRVHFLCNLCINEHPILSIECFEWTPFSWAISLWEIPDMCTKASRAIGASGSMQANDAYPGLLLDRNITDGWAMVCSLLTLAIGNDLGRATSTSARAARICRGRSCGGAILGGWGVIYGSLTSGVIARLLSCARPAISSAFDGGCTLPRLSCNLYCFSNLYFHRRL